jgi:hypothetical protein
MEITVLVVFVFVWMGIFFGGQSFLQKREALESFKISRRDVPAGAVFESVRYVEFDGVCYNGTISVAIDGDF